MIVDIPDAVVRLARIDPRVTCNERITEWSPEIREQFRNDAKWQEAIGPHDGLLVSPRLTDFIRRTEQGTKLAILFQDTHGNIFVQVGSFHKARTQSTTELRYGMNAGILLEERKHLHPERGGVTWTSFILAIAPLAPTARLTIRPDHDGLLFVSKLTQ